ncbi:hypothetical protein B0G69_7190 [Paraburkholderia sp. RAU2J]|nr:hypothetical protein B0G69_7190 [Paraburkholderia sp. RAU2J]
MSEPIEDRLRSLSDAVLRPPPNHLFDCPNLRGHLYCEPRSDCPDRKRGRENLREPVTAFHRRALERATPIIDGDDAARTPQATLAVPSNPFAPGPACPRGMANTDAMNVGRIADGLEAAQSPSPRITGQARRLFGLMRRDAFHRVE